MATQKLSIKYILLSAYKSFQDDHAPRLGAALAYYTVFSIAPLLIIVISIAGIVFGEEAVRGELFRQIAGLVGSDGAKLIQDAVAATSNSEKSAVATIAGVLILLFGATGLFIQLQDALNTIWKVRSVSKGLLGEVWARWTSFIMVLGIGFLLLVSLFLTTLLALITNFLSESMVFGAVLAEVAHAVASFGLTTLLFAMMYRILPGVRLEWRDMWFGAAITALLFVVGKALLGIYLGGAAVGSAYGAAGSAVVLLVWVYYCAQILLFGAECTHVVARSKNPRLLPGYELLDNTAWDVRAN